MVSLVDIVPQTRVVQLAAGPLELRGLGLRQIADLFLTFPSLRNIFTEGAPELLATELIVLAPDAIGAIIAEAAGQPEAAAKIVGVGSGIAPDELFDCLDAIYDLTFPRGISPFLAKVVPLLGLARAAPGEGQDMTSPPGLNGSSPTDTHPAL